MSGERPGRQRPPPLGDLLGLAVVGSLALMLLLLYPDRRGAVTGTAGDYLVEMMLVLPAVMVIMGLFAVWVPDTLVARHLGQTSGARGIALALALGTLPTGPLYVAFPLAAALISKGARVSNMVVFLSAWACIKLPQEMMELQFLGLEFMASRLLLTIGTVVVMGLLVEAAVEFRGQDMK
ncbi:MAG: hypothetical protein PHU95_00775 [Candidatus Thermoplasmatota archaeon]|nr:hypothetical protein [Candidatus Thermoplasmatota archaeon]